MKFTSISYTITIIFLSVLLRTVTTQIEDPIDLTAYKYPKPDESQYYQIALFATTDLHGRMFPMIYHNNKLGIDYESGGVEYMGSYISILRETWKDRFLWFDAGDQMKGGIEYALSKGEIMTSFYNTKKITAMTLGNHEFDEMQKLGLHMEKSNFDYIIANLKQKSTGKTEFLPKQVTSKIYQAGEVKIGVIGVVTNFVPSLSGGDTSDIEFLNHKDVIGKEAAKLRGEGAKAIILLAHMGPLCQNKDDLVIKKKVLLRKRLTAQAQCSYDDEFELLMSSIKGIVDVVISGHMHDISHHWINDMPVIESSGSDYSNVIYLSFDKSNNYQYIPNETILEGPLPSCNKLFSNTLLCEYLPEDKTTEDIKLKPFTFHDTLMTKDTELEDAFKEWAGIINNKRKNKLALSKSILFAEKYEETTLSNLITDLTRRKTEAHFALFNYGGMRATWYPGYITELDIDIMFPFDDPLATFVMRGHELIRLINNLHRKQNIVPTSGASQVGIKSQDGTIRVVDVRLFDGLKYESINDWADYTVGSVKFLLKGGGDGLNKIFDWYKVFDYKENYGTIKQAIMEFLPQIGELDDTMFIDKSHPRFIYTEPLE